MSHEDVGFVCLTCDVPMKLESKPAKGEFAFEATCPSCGARMGVTFDGKVANGMVEMARHEMTRLMNEDLAVSRGKVVRLGDNR